jgi:carbon-monoxide dehydrogenase large subunit
MGKFGTGQPVRRREDVRFLTGAGRYTDDVTLDGQALVWFVRSPLPHARITAIEADAARAMPGVIAVYTGKELDADPGVHPLPCGSETKNRQGEDLYKPARPVLALDTVRFIGELVAMVVAESAPAAHDAAEAIVVDYEDLPFVVDPARTIEPGAPQIWPEGNISVQWENRDPAEVVPIFESAAHVAEIEVVNNRVIANPIEPRAALADYDEKSAVSTLYCPSQGVHRIVGNLRRILDLPPDGLRIISGDVGGGFGVRSKAYPELALLVWASRKLRRPLKWRADRGETMMSDNHARDNVTRARLALGADGKILALWVDLIANMGAYLMENGPALPTIVGQRSMGTVYHIPALYQSVRCVFTNTTPVDAYRGAGRPETVYLVERIMDTAAVLLDLDPVEFRRRNLIRESAMPYTSCTNVVIDSGDFAGVLDKALSMADRDGFAGRRAGAAARGRLAGFGVACSLECSGGAPEEEARVRFEADGGATVFVGTFSQGQGHETVFAQVASEKLGLPYDKVRIVHAGDNTVVPFGLGTSASRSSQMGGVAIVRACEAVIDKARAVAAGLLQAEAGGVAFADGVFSAPDGASITIGEVAAHEAGGETALDETYRYRRPPGIFNFPNGCHIAEVEVDRQTGTVEIVRYTAVDDNGTILNPMIVHGQAHGAIAQGVGQALMERIVFDDETGQLFTASFLDYAMPRATDLPRLDIECHVVPCKTNDLGVKGAGEGGCCAAPPAIVAAVVDALKELGITHIDMPLTPERVWRAIRDAGN